MTEPEVLGFEYTISKVELTELELTFKFDNPFEISQYEPPERLRLFLYDDLSDDEDGVSK